VSDIVRQLEDPCASLRAVVLPSTGSHAACAHAGVAAGGDVTFGIDEEAERHLVAHVPCREAGIPVTGAHGESFDERLVLGSDASFQIAAVASGNAALQAELVAAVERGSGRLGRRPGRTAAARRDGVRTARRGGGE